MDGTPSDEFSSVPEINPNNCPIFRFAIAGATPAFCSIQSPAKKVKTMATVRDKFFALDTQQGCYLDELLQLRIVRLNNLQRYRRQNVYLSFLVSLLCCRWFSLRLSPARGTPHPSQDGLDRCHHHRG